MAGNSQPASRLKPSICLHLLLMVMSSLITAGSARAFALFLRPFPSSPPHHLPLASLSSSLSSTSRLSDSRRGHHPTWISRNRRPRRRLFFTTGPIHQTMAPSSTSPATNTATNRSCSIDFERLGLLHAPVLQSLRKAAVNGNVEEAGALIARLELDHVPLDLLTLTHYMQAHIVRRDAPGAEAVLARMKTLGLLPDIVPYSMLLNLHASRGNVGKAEEVFGTMREEGGLVPSVRAYTSLMKAYAVSRDPEGAEDVLFRMAAAGVAPDVHAYTMLLRAYANVGDVAGAEDVMRRVLLAVEGGKVGGREGGEVVPDLVIFNALLRVYVRSKGPDAARLRGGWDARGGRGGRA
ncbi:Tetratricopeptide-like helical, partial [Nannochloropsis gaditana]